MFADLNNRCLSLFMKLLLTSDLQIASKDVASITTWIGGLDFGKDLNLPLVLLGDNEGIVNLIRNLEHHIKSKHKDVSVH